MSAYVNVPRFWATPFRYVRWAARERPAFLWSVVIGAVGPVAALTIPPLRRAWGDIDAPHVPVSYPVPTTPRKPLTGYDDHDDESV